MIDSGEKKLKVSNLFFYLSYFMIVFETYFGNVVFINDIKDFFSIFEIILIIMCIFLQINRIKKKELIILIGVAAVSITSYIFSKNSNILFILLFFISSKDLDLKRFIRKDITIKSFFLVLVFVFLALGLTENNVAYRQNEQVRYTFGFNSPNTIGAICLGLCIEIAYLKDGKIKWRDSLIFIFLAYIIYKFSASRAATYCLFVLAMSPLFNKKIYFKKILPYIMLILTVISMVLILMYGKGGQLIEKIDVALSSRIKCGYNFYYNYKINLFGNYFIESKKWLGYANTLDNAYLDLLIHHGILMYIIVLFIDVRNMKINIEMKRNSVIFLIFLFHLYGFMERAPYNVVYNVLWMCNSPNFFNMIGGKIEKESINNNANI